MADRLTRILKSSKHKFVELDQDTAHVVAPQLLLLGVLRQETIQQVRQHALWLLALVPLIPNSRNKLASVVFVALPYAIAANNNKLVVFA